MCSLDPVWVSAIAAIVAALAAAVYAFFKWRLIREMQKDRVLAFKPLIKEIFWDDSSHYPEKLVFVLKNVGKGPALDLKIKCSDDRGIEWTLYKEILPIGSLETAEVILLLKEGKEKEELGEKISFAFKYRDIFDNPYDYTATVPRSYLELLRTRLPRK